jgi:hypothetical protein
MVKVPSANQPKSAATMVAPCLHDVTGDFRPCNEDELDLFQQTFKQDDLARGFGSLDALIHNLFDCQRRLSAGEGIRAGGQVDRAPRIG